MNILGIIGVSLILLPMIIFVIVLICFFISILVEEIKKFGWKNTLIDNSFIFAIISICLGLTFILMSNME